MRLRDALTVASRVGPWRLLLGLVLIAAIWLIEWYMSANVWFALLVILVLGSIAARWLLSVRRDRERAFHERAESAERAFWLGAPGESESSEPGAPTS